MVVLQLSIVFLTLIPLLVALWLILLFVFIATLAPVVVLLLLRPLRILILFIIAAPVSGTAAKAGLPILLLNHLLRFDRVGSFSLLARVEWPLLLFIVQ